MSGDRTQINVLAATKTRLFDYQCEYRLKSLDEAIQNLLDSSSNGNGKHSNNKGEAHA